MAKATGPASIRTLERLHRNVAKGLNLELERIIKAKEPIPAALLNAATAMLKVTGITEPKRSRAKVDRLAGLLDGYEKEDDNGQPADAATDFSTSQEPTTGNPSAFDDDFQS
jgi:hypothetical protein